MWAAAWLDKWPTWPRPGILAQHQQVNTSLTSPVSRKEKEATRRWEQAEKKKKFPQCRRLTGELGVSRHFSVWNSQSRRSFGGPGGFVYPQQLCEAALRSDCKTGCLTECLTDCLLPWLADWLAASGDVKGGRGLGEGGVGLAVGGYQAPPPATFVIGQN